MNRRRVGLYSGSFNPVHRGHVALASWLVQQGMVDEVWMVRTPHNPLKDATTLADDADRLAMLRLAVRGRRGLHVSTVEDALPQPNYTITTLRTLAQMHPDTDFHLIVGADNWVIFDRWRDWDVIVRDYHVIVYPRPGYEMPEVGGTVAPRVTLAVGAPQHDISSSGVRAAVACGRSVGQMLTPAVERYVRLHGLYR